jgi:hypothetical protein
MSFTDKFDSFCSGFKDYHVPSYLFMFSIGAILQWLHHLDATFVTFTAAILAALTGHQFSPAAKDQNNNPTQPNP